MSSQISQTEGGHAKERMDALVAGNTVPLNSPVFPDVSAPSEFLKKQQLFPVRCETQVISSGESPRGQTGLLGMIFAKSAVRSLHM